MIEVALFLIALVLMAVLYVDVHEDDTDSHIETKWGRVPAPRYGGAPVVLNAMLAHAKEMGNPDIEPEVHAIRKGLFRNLRNDAEAATSEMTARERFIHKYGERGIEALRVTDETKRLAALTAAEQDDLLQKVLTDKKDKKEPKQ